MRLSARAYNEFGEYLGRCSINFATKDTDYRWVESYIMVSIEQDPNFSDSTSDWHSAHHFQIVLYNKTCRRKVLIGLAARDAEGKFKFKFDHDEMKKRFTGDCTHGWGTKYIYETDKIPNFKGWIVK